ncbi:MAG: hypothetical protein Q9168_007022 [Polycauliona sp. 1 TL-2023]
MAQELVLITGGTGFVGYACVLRALNQGYRVRLAVRNESSIAKIKNAPSCQPHLGRIDFATVNDMTQKGAFDEALQDASYVIHVASPTPTPGADKAGPFHDTVVQPAVSGTVSMLQSAAKVPSVKRVVITSSASALLTDDQTKVHNAYKASQEFLRTEKPHFTIINIMPTFVVGKHELFTTPEDISSKTTNAIALAPIFGDGLPFPFPGCTVHIDDVAKIHVAALDPEIEGNQNFLVNAGGLAGIQWNDAKEIVRKRFPDAVDKGLLPLQGSTETRTMKVDGSKAERVFNFKYKDFEEQIVSVMEYYLEAVESSKQ